jgi:hypothetical protein
MTTTGAAIALFMTARPSSTRPRASYRCELLVAARFAHCAAWLREASNQERGKQVLKCRSTLADCCP